MFNFLFPHESRQKITVLINQAKEGAESVLPVNVLPNLVNGQLNTVLKGHIARGGITFGKSVQRSKNYNDEPKLAFISEFCTQL